MSDPRPRKHMVFKHDGVCRSCSGAMPAGKLGWWAAGSITWHDTCPEPTDALDAPFEESRESFDAWCARVNAEEHERYRAAKAVREQNGGSASADTGTAHHGTAGVIGVKTADNVPTATVTSDPKYQEAF